jgi:hypothetical protein
MGGALYFAAFSTGSGTELWALRAPTASLGNYTVPAGGSVTLTGSGTNPDAGSPLTYTWDLDADGNFGETGSAAARGDEVGQSPAFSAPGIGSGAVLPIVLRVTNTGGLKAQASASVTVRPPSSKWSCRRRRWPRRSR